MQPTDVFFRGEGVGEAATVYLTVYSVTNIFREDIHCPVLFGSHHFLLYYVY